MADAESLGTGEGSMEGFLQRMRSEVRSIRQRTSKHGTQIHVTALDEVVSVNSFFTIAVFLGLTLSSHDAALDTQCTVGENAVKYLIVYEVVSFSCFLYSSLVAHALKLLILFANGSVPEDFEAGEVNNRLLRFGMLASAAGSVAGTIFLLLSMLSIIELRLGPFSCGSSWTERAGIPLITLVFAGISIFVSAVVFAFLH